MSKTRTVAVTGGTGFVGRSVVRELLSRGYAVRALVRDRSKAREVFPPGGTSLTLVDGDVSDARSVAGLAAGCDAFIHLVGIIREQPGGVTFRHMHVDAVRHSLEACLETGVRRFIHMSALGASDEGVSEYQKTKFEGETLVRASALDWTIFRPGMIHGADGEFINTAVDWSTGHVPPYFFMPYFTRYQIDTSVPLGGATPVDPRIAPVAVEDVAEAFRLALERDASIGEVYALVGSETLTWPELLAEIRDHVPGGRQNLMPWGVPGEPAALAARAASMIGLGGLLPFDEGMARMGAQDSVASSDKVRAHLGLVTSAFRTGFREYAGRIGAFEA